MQIETIDLGQPIQLTMTQPDDWHLHLRDGIALESVVGFSAARFGRAIIMPNLKPPVTTVAQAVAYWTRILNALLDKTWHRTFTPLMTLYLTSNTSPDEIRRAKEETACPIVACKLYPAGATTNSAAGVSDIREIYPVLEVMQEVGMMLCIHGEVTDPTVDIFDREAVFIDRVLIPLRRDFPGLKVVFEHLTTKEGADYVWDGGKNIAATITAHHLLYNRNAIFLSTSGATGLYPDNYCLPVLKRESHRRALVQAAISGNPKYFLGTDSAPHAAILKDTAPSCAGCFTAPAALELYAEAFEEAGALGMLEGFASHFGADFYGLPRNQGTITLARVPWQIPKELPFGDALIKPLRAGETTRWKFTT